MILPYPQIVIELILLSIEKVITFEVKFNPLQKLFPYLTSENKKLYARFNLELLSQDQDEI